MTDIMEEAERERIAASLHTEADRLMAKGDSVLAEWLHQLAAEVARGDT